MLGGDFGFAAIGHLLNDLAKLDLQAAWQFHAEIVFHDVGNTTFARLTIDANHSLVIAAKIGGVNGKVGDIPNPFIACALGLQAFADRVLVRARESREHELADIRMARVDGQAVAVFDGTADSIYIREIQTRVNSLREEIEGNGHNIDVAGAFSVAEKGALNAICASEHAQLGCRNSTAAVVMRMDAKRNLLALGVVTMEVFDLIREDIGHGHLDGCRQIHNDRLAGDTFPDIVYAKADLDSEVEFGAGEAFW